MTCSRGEGSGEGLNDFSASAVFPFSFSLKYSKMPYFLVAHPKPYHSPFTNAIRGRDNNFSSLQLSKHLNSLFYLNLTTLRSLSINICITGGIRINYSIHLCTNHDMVKSNNYLNRSTAVLGISSCSVCH